MAKLSQIVVNPYTIQSPTALFLDPPLTVSGGGETPPPPPVLFNELLFAGNTMVVDNAVMLKDFCTVVVTVATWVEIIVVVDKVDVVVNVELMIEYSVGTLFESAQSAREVSLIT